MASTEMQAPATLQKRSGSVVNEVSPNSASAPRRRRLKLDCPLKRSAGTKGRATVWNPTQAYSPFMKRLRSGRALSACTTLRSISRKSPALRGMRMLEPKFISR